MKLTALPTSVGPALVLGTLTLALVAAPSASAQDAEAPAAAADAGAEEGEAAEPAEEPAEAAAAPAEVPPEVEARIRAEVRAELREEMKDALDQQREQLRGEIRAAVASSLATQEWQPESWEVEEEEQKLEFFDLDGYFRFRGDLFSNFDLNAGTDINDRPLFPRPGWNPDGSDTLATSNQRLRLEPVFNVSEDVKVKATVDVLDNLVWGQTPDAFPLNLSTQNTPMLAFTGTEAEPIAGQNAAFNSISVKRVWAEVMTPVGQLRFGRLASNWGLGLLANDGNCLDCDHGDTVDRLMFVTKIADHYIVPAMDTPATGRILKRRDTYQGQPFDLEQRDDVQQYVLAVARRDTPEDIEKLLVDGRVVLNYGMYNVLRVHNIDSVAPGIYQDGELSPDNFVTRGAKAYIPDIWVRLHVGKLRVELEAVAIVGRIDNGELLSEPDPGQDAHLDIRQYAAVLQSDYKLARDQLRLGFEVGFASGDEMPGMGIVATPGGNIQPPTDGAIDGKQFNLDRASGELDNTIANFKFDPDYHVDLILWREIFGQVTDALYFKPSVSYELTRSLGFDIAAIYSRTIFAQSAPGGVNDLGFEIDGTLRYRASDGFGAQLQYGILIPLRGLELQNRPEIAQTIQGAFAVEF